VHARHQVAASGIGGTITTSSIGLLTALAGLEAAAVSVLSLAFLTVLAYEVALAISGKGEVRVRPAPQPL